MEYASHRPKSAAMQKNVLELMCGVGSVSVKELCYFTGASTATVNRLEKLGYLTLTEQPVLRCREIRPAKLNGPLVLSPDQQRCYDGLAKQMTQENPGVALLTGRDRLRARRSVYLKLIQTCLADGQKRPASGAGDRADAQLLGLLTAYFGDSGGGAAQQPSGRGNGTTSGSASGAGDAKVVIGNPLGGICPAAAPGPDHSGRGAGAHL